MIDNIIQTLKNKRLGVTVADAVGTLDQNITISAGIGSLSKGDIIKWMMNSLQLRK